MKRTTTLFLYLWLSFALPLTAQNLIPYLGNNGLYGFADESGKVVITPQFGPLFNIFEAHSPAFPATKDGQPVWVLHNGMVLPNTDGRVKPSFVSHFTRSEITAADTLTQLVSLSGPTENTIIHLPTGKTMTFPKPSGSGMRLWFPVEGGMRPTDQLDRFRYGIARVGRPGDLLNFIDTSLQLIFAEDFAAATMIDDTFFIVANAARQCAVADRSGRVRFKYRWQIIAPTGQKGIFIVDPPTFGIEVKKGQTGLINADGKLIVPAKYDDIRVANDHLLIFKTRDGEGLMDYAGHVLMPAAAGTLKETEGDMFIHTLQNNHQLVNAKGEKMMPETFDALTFFQKNRGVYTSHFQYQTGAVSGVIRSADLTTISRDSVPLSGLLHINAGAQTFFRIKRKIGAVTYLGLININGETILNTEYDDIRQSPDPNFWILKKGVSEGCFSLDGKMILPCSMEQISILPDQQQQPVIYARAKGAGLWLAYNSTGGRRPEQDCFDPLYPTNDPVVILPKRGQPDRKIGFRDGTIIQAPAEWGTYFNLKGTESPAGLLLWKENPDRVEFFDRTLRPLIPEGFTVWRSMVNFEQVKNTGLFPVYRNNPNARPEPAPQEENERSTPPVKQEIPLVDAAPIEVWQNLPAGGGLMNARGEWVIPPTEGVRLEPITWSLVLEYPINATSKSAQRLHLVNCPNPGVIPYAGGNSLPEQSTYKVNTQVEDPENPGQKVIRSTWFTAAGEQLAPFRYNASIPVLKSHNAVMVYEKKQSYWAIINERAQIIQALPELTPDYATGLQNGWMAALKNGKWGVIDSTGATVVPFQFGHLWVLPGKMLCEEVEPGQKYHLLNAKGEIKGTSTTQIQPWPIPGGYTALLLNAGSSDKSQTVQTAVIQPNGTLVTTVAGTFLSPVKVKGQTRFVQIKDKNGLIYLLNLANGVTYRENN